MHRPLILDHVCRTEYLFVVRSTHRTRLPFLFFNSCTLLISWYTINPTSRTVKCYDAQIVIMKPSSIAMLFRAVDSLRNGRNVLIVARPRSYAFGVARILIAVAKRLGITLANHRGADQSCPWVYARGHDDPIELIAKDADVFRDASACFERPNCPPPKMRSVEG